MKIIVKDEKWVKDSETELLKVDGITDRVFSDIPFKLTSVQHKEVETSMEFIYFPYINDELKKAVGGLAYDISTNNDWCYPDYDNVKLSIWVHMDGEAFSASLRVDVQPPKYTLEDIDDVFITKDIVNAATDFHNGTALFCETMGLYDIEFTQEEQNQLMWFLIGHLEMVCNGGHYIA